MTIFEAAWLLRWPIVLMVTVIAVTARIERNLR